MSSFPNSATVFQQAENGRCASPEPSSLLVRFSGLLPSERLAMEPPRYCTACRRRMKVQVTPLGWSAECSRHGVLVP